MCAGHTAPGPAGAGPLSCERSSPAPRACGGSRSTRLGLSPGPLGPHCCTSGTFALPLPERAGRHRSWSQTLPALCCPRTPRCHVTGNCARDGLSLARSTLTHQGPRPTLDLRQNLPSALTFQMAFSTAREKMGFHQALHVGKVWHSVGHSGRWPEKPRTSGPPSRSNTHSSPALG